MRKTTLLTAILAMGGMLYASPSHAQFKTLAEKQGDLNQQKEHSEQQREDIASIREAMQENTILLKGMLLETQKQTELLNAINTEQKNHNQELSRQTELLEKLIESTASSIKSGE